MLCILNVLEKTGQRLLPFQEDLESVFLSVCKWGVGREDVNNIILDFVSQWQTYVCMRGRCCFNIVPNCNGYLAREESF